MKTGRRVLITNFLLISAFTGLVTTAGNTENPPIIIRVTPQKTDWKFSPVIVPAALIGSPPEEIVFRVSREIGGTTQAVPFIQKTMSYPPRVEALAWIKEGIGEAYYQVKWSSLRKKGTHIEDQKIPLIGIGEPISSGSSGSVGWMTAGYNSSFDSADLDGDGDPDLLVVSAGEREVDTLRGTYFYENLGPQQPGILSSPYKLCDDTQTFSLFDWNGDGKPDLTGSGWYRLNQSNGHAIRFSEPFGLNGFPSGSWDVCDLDADGKLDLLIGQGDGQGYRPRPGSYDPALEPPYTGPGVWKGERTIGRLLWVPSFREPNADERASDKGILLAESSEGQDAWGGWYPDAVDWEQDGDMDVLIGSLFNLHLLENDHGKFHLRSIDIPNADPHSGIHLRPRAVDWDLDGDVDILIAQESGFITFCENCGGGEIKPPVPLKGIAPFLDVGCLSTPTLTDWNGDGILDLLSGNSYGQLLCFESSPEQKNPSSPFAWKSCQPKAVLSEGVPILIQAGMNGSIQGPEEARYGYTNPEFCDWDGDGLVDVLLGDVWGYTRWYRNLGSPTQPWLGKSQGLGVSWHTNPPPKPAWCWFEPGPGELLSVWRTKPETIDWNRDGLIDLVTLDHEGFLSLFLRSIEPDGTRSLNPGQRIFLDPEGHPLHFGEGVAGRAGRGKFDLVDWDQDGDHDLLAYEFDTMKSIGYYENISNDASPVLRYNGDLLTPSGIILAGHSTTPCALDLDRDGHLDLLVGCEDGLVYAFHRAFIECDLPLVSKIDE